MPDQTRNLNSVTDFTGTLDSNDRIIMTDNKASLKALTTAILGKTLIEGYAGSSLAGSSQSVKSAIDTLNSNVPIYKGTVPGSLSDLTVPGFYYYGSTVPSDAPSNRQYGQVIVLGAISGAASHLLQIVTTSSYHIYYRRKEGNATDSWSDWREFTITAV